MGLTEFLGALDDVLEDRVEIQRAVNATRQPAEDLGLALAASGDFVELGVAEGDRALGDEPVE